MKPKSEVSYSFYETLPTTLKSINISGGEPFLRSDLIDIIGVISSQCKEPRIVISTNGLMPKRIEEQTRKILESKKDIGVRVSIDGLERIHDRIRGTGGAFVKAIKSVQILKSLGIRDLGIAYTAMGHNLTNIPEVYDLANKLGVEFAIGVAYDSPIYFNNVGETYHIDFNELEKQIRYIGYRELKSWDPKRWFRAYFEKGLVDYCSGRKKLVNCGAAKDFFYLDPFGNVYPCTVLNKKLGNLQDSSFTEIWNSEQTREARAYIMKCPYNCWMVCNAAPIIKKRLEIPLLWILWNKLITHLRTREA